MKAVNRIREDLLRYTKTSKIEELERSDPTNISRKPKLATSGVIVEDIENCMIKFARCCTPVPGDDIVGFITKGFGVSIHRRDCPNAAGAASPENSGRWVKVTWARTPLETYSTSFELSCDDRDGLALDVAMAISAMKLKCSELAARADHKGRCMVYVTVEVRDSSEVSMIQNRLGSIRSVRAVRRGRS